MTLLALLCGLPLLLTGGATTYYAARGSRHCGSCHEIRASVATWHASTHRTIDCSSCHGGIATPRIDFHLGNLRRVLTHLRGHIPERVRIKDQHVDGIVERCARCHQQEHAEWAAGPHGAPYGRLFVDSTHNAERALTNDCLRCHGMYFEGPISSLVTPIDTEGPWRFRDEKMHDRPAIPCMACHQIHRAGRPIGLASRGPTSELASLEPFRPSLAFYDRRGQAPLRMEGLPLPKMQVEGRPVLLSPDPRQTLCYQCHAPLASFEVGTGDDRTGVGVHEGISCLACHARHVQNARASCAACHPALSNCGKDVETMDTTFRDPDSSRNIHFVACQDCHEGRRPAGRASRLLPIREARRQAGGS